VIARPLNRALPVLALALGAVLAFGLVSCGSDDEGLLPGDNAQQIVDNLNQVEQDVDNGDCESAAANAEEVQVQIDELGSGVDSQLRQRLSEGAEQLQQVIADSCVATATIPTVETTTEPTTTEETTTDEEEPDTTTTTTAPTTTTTTTAPTTTVPPTGGTPDDGGVVPPDGSGEGGDG
jgi:hypothetical protein